MKLLPATHRYIQLGLLCLSTVFVFSIWLEFNHDYAPQPDATGLQSGPDNTSMNQDYKARDLPPLSDFASIIERPLFTPDRRPAGNNMIGTIEVEPSQQTPGSLMSGDLLLSAVVVDTDKAIALIQSAADHKIHRLETGESIDGWTVREIRDREVVLARGNETRNLELQVKKSPATGSTLQRRRRSATATNTRPVPVRQAAQGIATGTTTSPAPQVNRTQNAEQENNNQPIPEQVESQK